tara:strand:+ start:384 stop:1682 length:1299 start_codon:yes stop_codon:yes gene_type:complete
MSTIKVYKDQSANSIFIEDANGAQFLNSLQATLNSNDLVEISDLAKGFPIVSNATHTDFIDENGNVYVGNATEVCNELNAIFSSSGTPSADPPTITSPLGINLTQGEIINYELTANLGVGYEWDLSNVPGVTTVDGNVRKLIGGSSLTTGEYAIPVKAINYNGEDSQIIDLSVGNPAFANTKSVNFNNNDWLGANAGILQNSLGRTGNGSGISDAWSISFWFKAGTATNASQTIFYFGNQDVTNQGCIQIKYNGSLNRLEMRYGSSNNRLDFFTQQNSVPSNQWEHYLITYDGGTTGSASNSVTQYYSRFKFFIGGVDVTNTNIQTHNNFGYNGSIEPQNLRVGRFNNGQSMRNNCRLDELAVYNDDVSSLISEIYNGGNVVDLMDLSTEPEHWWRMGDGDTYPYLFDVGFQANCIFVMNSMTSADIVNDVP